MLVKNSSWSLGTPIVIDIDGLGLGSYEYRIEVHNRNETKEDIVILTVIPRPDDDPPIIIIIIIIIVIGSAITISTTSLYLVRESIVVKWRPDKYKKKKKFDSIEKETQGALPEEYDALPEGLS